MAIAAPPTLVTITDAIDTQVARVCREWGFQRPKVHVSYRAERMNYSVIVLFEQRWQVNWETDGDALEEFPPEMFDDMAEGWAMDANVPLTKRESGNAIDE